MPKSLRVHSPLLNRRSVVRAVLLDEQNACRARFARVSVRRPSWDEGVRPWTQLRRGSVSYLNDHRSRNYDHAKIARVEMRPVLKSANEPIEPPVRPRPWISPKNATVLTRSGHHPFYGVCRK
jgi:hypothetical protein